MKQLFLSIILVSFGLTALQAETNNTKNSTGTTKIITQKQVNEQIKREKKYAKERVFYQGKDYNLSAVEVNKKSLSSIPKIEPDYDFNMDDAYSDDQ